MTTFATHNPIYEASAEGILLQTGSLSDFGNSSASSLLAVKERAIALRSLFAANDADINDQSVLARLIADAIYVSDARLCNDQNAGYSHFFNAMQLERIATAVLPLAGRGDAAQHLRKLLRGTLDLLKRERSEAKDSLWELELWALLGRLGISASLEEPDIVVSFDPVRTGIACKKIYSEANVSKVISDAVAQIERDFDIGGVALNIDDLCPPDAVYKAASHEEIVEGLRRFSYEFIARHEHTLRKYLTPGRAVFALISVGLIGHATNEQVKFNNVRATLVWNIPGVSEARTAQVRNLLRAFDAAHRL